MCYVRCMSIVNPAHLRFTTPTTILRRDKITQLTLYHPETFFHLEGPVSVENFDLRFLRSLQGEDKDHQQLCDFES